MRLCCSSPTGVCQRPRRGSLIGRKRSRERSSGSSLRTNGRKRSSDTSQPIITPPAVEQPPAAQSVRLPPDDAGDQSNLEALAELKRDTPSAAVDHPTLRIKHGLPRTVRSKRVARGPVTRRLARVEAGGGCCQFGWIDNGQASSNAMSRRHAASSWPMDWPALTGRN